MSKLEELCEDGTLAGKEHFVFTDNSVFEGTFYKGHSKSRKLNDIILRLRKGERKSEAVLHVMHISGTRMKASGINGLSLGDMMEGMLRSGDDPMTYVPLNEAADVKSEGAVTDWVNSWWEDSEGCAWCDSDLRVLTPEDWFSLYRIDEPRLWVPPPVAMQTCLELFNEDRIINPHIPHVFVLPHLMTHLWRKDLGKDADVLFTVACGAPFLPDQMFEPLVVAIVLPLTHVPNYRGPWVVRGSLEATRLEERLIRGFVHWTKARHDPKQLHDLEGTCQVCGALRKNGAGIFCSNFLLARNPFPRATMFDAETVIAQPRAAHFPSGTTLTTKRKKERANWTWRRRRPGITEEDKTVIT